MDRRQFHDLKRYNIKSGLKRAALSYNAVCFSTMSPILRFNSPRLIYQNSNMTPTLSGYKCNFPRLGYLLRDLKILKKFV